MEWRQIAGAGGRGREIRALCCGEGTRENRVDSFRIPTHGAADDLGEAPKTAENGGFLRIFEATFTQAVGSPEEEPLIAGKFLPNASSNR